MTDLVGERAPERPSEYLVRRVGDHFHLLPSRSVLVEQRHRVCARKVDLIHRLTVDDIDPGQRDLALGRDAWLVDEPNEH